MIVDHLAFPAVAGFACPRSGVKAHEPRQDREPFPGPLIGPRLAGPDLLLSGQVLGPDRAGRRPRRPPGWVLHRPLGDVEVERTDGGQIVQSTGASFLDLAGLAVGPGDPTGLDQDTL